MKWLIKGRVQRAGFRDFIQQQAYRFDVTGTVRNLPDGPVEVIAEGAEKALNQFLAAFRAPPRPIAVEHVAAEVGRPTGEFTDFIIKWDSNEAIIDKLETGFRFVKDMDRNLGDKMDATRTELGGKIDGLGQSLGGKMDSLGGKIDNLANAQQTFATKVDSHFELLASRYDRISKDLRQILKEMQAERRDARKAHQELIKFLVTELRRDRPPRR